MKVAALLCVVTGLVALPAAAQSADPIADAYNQFLTAQRLEEDNDIAGAIAAYKRAITLDPKSAEISAELASLYMNQGRAAEAMTQAEQALKVDADNAEAHRVVGTLYATLAGQDQNDRAPRGAALDNLTKAISNLEASIAHPIGAPDANTRAMLSRLYITAGDYDKAVATLTDLVKQEPGWQDGAQLLVQAYAAAGRSAEAVAFLEEAAPDNPRLYPALAEFYGREDRWQDAAQTYAQALQLAPQNFDLRVGYGAALLNTGGIENATKARDALRDAVATRGNDQRALYLLSQAERLAGDLDAAEGTARRLIAVNRTSTRAYLALAEALEERQRYQAVVDAIAPIIGEFRSGTNAATTLPVLLPHLGFAYQQLGKADSAVTAFEEALKLSPGDQGLSRELVEAQIAAKNYAAAVATAETARASHPNDLQLARLEAQALRQNGKTDQGLAVLQGIVQVRGDDSAAYVALAQGYSDANRGAQAVQVLRDAESKFPNDSTITFELGAVLDKQKKFADAEATFRQLLARDPENAPALNYLGYLLADRGERLDESVSLLQRALKLEPENGSYLDSLGWAYYKGGKLDLAEDNLRRAADRMEANSVIQDHWGDLLFKLGRYDEAITAWSRALSGHGDSLDHAEIDKKIKSAKQKLPKK